MRGPAYISVETAAQRSGRSPGHLKRLARDTWAPAGLARKVQSDSGQWVWTIREDAAPELARVKSVEQLDDGFDLRALSDRHRRQLLRRRDILLRWIEAREAGVKLAISEQRITADFIARLELDEGDTISRRTLFNWHREYRTRGLAGLVDARWSAATAQATDDDPFHAEVKRLYLDARQRSKQLCYDKALEMAEERGWAIPSYRTICRLLDKIPLRTLKLYREGDQAFKAVAPYIERDYTTIAANDVWFSDHHPLDLLVLHEGKHVRPTLTAWMDARSRKIVGWRIFCHAANSDTILAAFVDAAHPERGDHGIPRVVYIDNGKDFDSFSLQGRTKKQRRRKTPLVDAGVFGDLGIDVVHAQPHHPQAKTIERHFRTISERFTTDFATHTGGSTDRKPHDLADQLKRGNAPTLQEVIDAFGNWLDVHHARAQSGHGMDGRGPAEVWRAELRSKRVPRVDLLEVLALKRTQPISVGRNGVTLDGVTYGRDEPQLIARQGKGKCVKLRYDDTDRSRVQVYDLDGKLLCVAAANERMPFMARDSQALRDAMAESRRDRRVAREWHQTQPRMTDTLQDRLYRQAQRRRKAAEQHRDADPPPSIAPVRSAFEDQLPALREALDAPSRIAVGAESIDPDQIRSAFPRPAGSNDTSGDGDAFAAFAGAFSKRPQSEEDDR